MALRRVVLSLVGRFRVVAKMKEAKPWQAFVIELVRMILAALAGYTGGQI